MRPCSRPSSPSSPARYVPPLFKQPQLIDLSSQLGDAHQALSLLALTVHDHTSAAAFCTSHGAVVPPRATAQLAERAGLAAWALASAASQSTPDAPTESAETQRLLNLLLTIYTSNNNPYVTSPSPSNAFLSCMTPHRTTPDSPAPTPTATETAAAHLLASHAPSFDAPAVLTTLPPRWPLRALSPYLVCALRTAAHTAHERALVKALAAGQNLGVADVAHAQLRAAGALVEEAVSDEDEVDGELDEKAELGAPGLIGKTESADATADTDVVVGSWMSGRSSVTNASAGVGYSQ